MLILMTLFTAQDCAQYAHYLLPLMFLTKFIFLLPPIPADFNNIVSHVTAQDCAHITPTIMFLTITLIFLPPIPNLKVRQVTS